MGRGNQLRKLTAGETRATISRQTYNALIEAIDYSKREQFQQRAGTPREARSQTVITVRNNTGAPVSRFGVLELGEPLVTATQNEAEFLNRITFDGETPADASAPFCVLLEPLAAGAIGRAVVMGAVPCLLDVRSEAHGSAAPVPGQAGYLRSAASGGAVILWVEPAADGTGADPVLRDAYVLLAPCCAAEGSGTYSETVGDGIETTFVIEHGLGSEDVIVTVRDTATGEIVTYDPAIVDSITVDDTDNVTVTFVVAPSTDEYTVVVGLPGGSVPGIDGPATSVDNALVRWDGTSATLLQSSAVTLDDGGNLSGVASVSTGSTSTMVVKTESEDVSAVRVVETVRHTTSGNAAAGFGVATSYEAENASGNVVEVGRTSYVYTDATDGSEDASWTVNVVTGGALTEALRVVSPGLIRLPETSEPAGNPAAGFGYFYLSSGVAYVKDSAGTVTALGGGGGGVGSEGTVAATGSVQGDAAAITENVTEVTGADGTKGVILTDGEAAEYVVWNSDGANNLKVYPPSGHAIAQLATNANVTLANNAVWLFRRLSSDQWTYVVMTSAGPAGA